MMQKPWELGQSWDELTPEAKERLLTATKALDYHIYHGENPGETGGATSVQYNLGRSEEWSQPMKGIFNSWCRDGGHRVSFADGTDGTLMIRLEL